MLQKGQELYCFGKDTSYNVWGRRKGLTSDRERQRDFEISHHSLIAHACGTQMCILTFLYLDHQISFHSISIWCSCFVSLLHLALNLPSSLKSTGLLFAQPSAAEMPMKLRSCSLHSNIVKVILLIEKWSIYVLKSLSHQYFDPQGTRIYRGSHSNQSVKARNIKV